jgi:hypothetical protein
MIDERRKEPRHVVVGIDATLNGATCAIIDISRTGVRLLRPPVFESTEQPVVIDFTLLRTGRSRARAFRVEGRLVRATAIDVTYAYAPPIPQWESLLRARDTFMQTALSRL